MDERIRKSFATAKNSMNASIQNLNLLTNELITPIYPFISNPLINDTNICRV